MWLLLGVVLAGEVPAEMAQVPGGTYAPLYAADPEQPTVTVGPFLLDRRPVSKADYQAFVIANPRWRRDRIKALFADERYLQDWAGPLDHGGRDNQPAVRVSWFAARAYCAAQGKRLPTEDEWEVAAGASTTAADGRGDPARSAEILKWYLEPASDERVIGERAPNVFGIHDLHGLSWEWVEDFNNTLYGADNREGGDDDTLRFCGAGVLSAADAEDYATFARVAFRTSLQATYTTASLGFRCARDVEP
ncbi:MAG: sulfatase modifying factor 1 [Myxococcota bacterium]|jgi:sulfatase modifying factor 1